MVILIIGKTQRPPNSAPCRDQDRAGSGSLVYICAKPLTAYIKPCAGYRHPATAGSPSQLNIGKKLNSKTGPKMI